MKKKHLLRIVRDLDDQVRILRLDADRLDRERLLLLDFVDRGHRELKKLIDVHGISAPHAHKDFVDTFSNPAIVGDDQRGDILGWWQLDRISPMPERPNAEDFTYARVLEARYDPLPRRVSVRLSWGNRRNRVWIEHASFLKLHPIKLAGEPGPDWKPIIRKGKAED